MTSTPAVGVGAGRIGGRSANQTRGWPFALRSALLLGSLSLVFVASLATPTPAFALTDSLDLRATYEVTAQINWKRATINVQSVAHVTNTRPDAIDRLTFNLLPLKLGKGKVEGASVDGVEARVTVSDQSVLIDVPGRLEPGADARVRIDYTATFNTSPRKKKVLFMKKDNILAAYRWIPWLSREQNFKTPNFGESWVTAVSPRVEVTLISEKPLVFATSGRETGGQTLQQTFVATDVRDFNFSASPNYSVRHETFNGIDVDIYTRSYSPDRLWKWARIAFDGFTDRVGPYPYSHFTIAETPEGIGMESPAMIWVDSSLEKARFSYTVVHETAHEWFYATVGNNQAADPFVDEALADFLTRDLLGSFRKSYCAKARLDGTVYEYGAACYPEVIYVQGGLYLNAYRAEVGADAFWRGLQDFYRDKTFELAGTRSLLEHLDAASGYDSSRHQDRFPTLY
ncbi:MAG: hypothetical protein ABIP53_09825 [Candidatus Limnocylindrales bacterium]